MNAEMAKSQLFTPALATSSRELFCRVGVIREVKMTRAGFLYSAKLSEQAERQVSFESTRLGYERSIQLIRRISRLSQLVQVLRCWMVSESHGLVGERSPHQLQSNKQHTRYISRQEIMGSACYRKAHHHLVSRQQPQILIY
jgi:hypothetical protein